MAGQDFDWLVASTLLERVEGIVIASHQRLHQEVLQEPWSPAQAYRWLRYEDPDPVGRLRAGSLELGQAWARAPGVTPATAGAHASQEQALLDAALAVAAGRGYTEPG